MDPISLIIIGIIMKAFSGSKWALLLIFVFFFMLEVMSWSNH